VSHVDGRQVWSCVAGTVSRRTARVSLAAVALNIRTADYARSGDRRTICFAGVYFSSKRDLGDAALYFRQVFKGWLLYGVI